MTPLIFADMDTTTITALASAVCLVLGALGKAGVDWATKFYQLRQAEDNEHDAKTAKGYEYLIGKLEQRINAVENDNRLEREAHVNCLKNQNILQGELNAANRALEALEGKVRDLQEELAVLRSRITPQ
jgi:hypothetical protein